MPLIDEEYLCDKIAYSITRILVRYGRTFAHGKEKYGTVRVYVTFGWYGLQSIVYPNYVYNQFPNWLFVLDLKVFGYLIKPLNLIVVPWQKFLYKLSYRYYIKKYPNMEKAILCCADYPELIK